MSTVVVRCGTLIEGQEQTRNARRYWLSRSGTIVSRDERPLDRVIDARHLTVMPAWSMRTCT